MGKNRHSKDDKGLPWVQLYHWIRKTEAWRSLGPYSRLLYIEIRGRYNGSNNGNISMSYREAQELLGCSNKPIPNAFWELEDRGFIKPVQKGTFSWKVRFEGSGRATTWLLTELRQDHPVTVLIPTSEFKQWKPAEQKKTRHAKSGLMARPKRAITAPMARPKRAYDTPKAGHSGQKLKGNGTLKAGTTNLPDIPAPVGDITTALTRSLKRRGWSSGGRL